MADVAPPRPPFRSLWVAVPAAAVAAFIGLFVVGPIATVPPGWLGMALHSAAIAAIWMLAGGYFAPRTHVALGVLFVPGAALCAFLSLGFVHSVSAYYGITAIALACASGAVVWFRYTRDLPPGSARSRAFVVPALTAGALISVALLRPGVGLTRVMTTPDHAKTTAYLTFRASDESRRGYVWTREFYRRDSFPVGIDLDPGSGDVLFTLHRVGDESERAVACQAFRTSARALAARNVADGTIPGVVAMLPQRQIGCSAGSFWRAEPREHRVSPTAPPP